MSVSLALLLTLTHTVLAAPPQFERDVRPILAAHCLHCHGGLKQESGLDLRTIAFMERGGENGAAVVPGDVVGSPMWEKIATDEMPQTLIKLSAAEKETIRTWIEAKTPASPAWKESAIRPAAETRKPAEVAQEIDRVIAQRLTEAKLSPAPLADDEAFLRRATLDLTGRVPEPDRIRQFQGSSAPDKRAQLIDELLASPAYGQHFGQIWHHRLMPLVEDQRRYDEPLMNWLAKQFNDGASWPATVTELIAAQGPTTEHPSIAFLGASKEYIDKLGVRVARSFLGMHMECAECHDHPTKLWRQKEDYWAIAAFFSSMKIEKIKDGVYVASDSAPRTDKKGKPLHPVVRIRSGPLGAGKNDVPARFPGALEPLADLQPPYRARLAEWIVSPENDYFVAATANRWWAHFFGSGLIDPVDDLHEHNPATHPEVLRLLADELVAAKFDLRHLARCITLTEAYQRTSEGLPNADEQEKLYGRMAVRSLSPDVLYTIYGQALESHDLPLPLVSSDLKRKPQPTIRELFVNSFSPSEDHNPLANEQGVLQVLQLMNWETFNAGGSLVARLTSSQSPAAAIADEIYLRALSRLPTDAERQKVLAYVERQDDAAAAAWSSVLWLLVNSSEFVLNH